MPVFQSHRRVAHSRANMFALVADIERYPEFVPLCTGMTLRSRQSGAEGVEMLIAEMHVGYKAVRERFASRVTLDAPKSRILVEYIDGPFSRMDNRWTFRDAETGSDGQPACDVEFYIAYEFRSRMLAMLMGAMFDAAYRKFVSAFEARADRVYGIGGGG